MKRMKMMKSLVIAIVLVLVVGGVCGCSGDKKGESEKGYKWKSLRFEDTEGYEFRESGDISLAITGEKLESNCISICHAKNNSTYDIYFSEDGIKNYYDNTKSSYDDNDDYTVEISGYILYKDFIISIMGYYDKIADSNTVAYTVINDEDYYSFGAIGDKDMDFITLYNEAEKFAKASGFLKDTGEVIVDYYDFK